MMAPTREQEHRPDRPVPVLARHRHDPRKGGEHAREISDAEQVALVPGRDEIGGLGEQACEQREEDDDADHPHDDAGRRTRRLDFQKLSPKLSGHAARSVVSPRKTSPWTSCGPPPSPLAAFIAAGGGKLSLESARGAGTSLYIELPLDDT
jgi:hypothetical protein